MASGYIYIASNPCLPIGLLKIGLTHDNPGSRVDQLSRCTSIPDAYFLEHWAPVSDVVAAEIRIHMLLGKHRYRTQKEFFNVNLHSAIDLINWISDYLDTKEGFSENFSLHQSLDDARFSRRISNNMYKMVYTTYAFASGQSIIDHISGFSNEIVSGFASWEALAVHFKIKKNAMIKNMQLFCNSADDLRYKLCDGNEIRIYERLHYHKGHMAWKFDAWFRNLLINEKI